MVRAKVREGDVVVDATCGNGNDTLFLAQLVGPRGRVVGCDVQPAALAATAARLAQADDASGAAGAASEGGTATKGAASAASIAERCTLHLASHSELAALVPPEAHGTVAAAMFNLGYLPGSDEAVITTANTTLPALEQALALLRPDGLLSVLVYPGHPGGEVEAQAVDSWAAGLPTDSAQAVTYRPTNRPTAPYGIFISKR
jgi:SAM-dependent methyltransferase